MLNVKEVAKRYRVTVSTIYRWMNEGLFPAPITIGSTVRWSEKTLDQWESEGCPKYELPAAGTKEALKKQLDDGEAEFNANEEAHDLAMKRISKDNVLSAIQKFNKTYTSFEIEDELNKAREVLEEKGVLAIYESALKVFRVTPQAKSYEAYFETWAGIYACEILKEEGFWPWAQKQKKKNEQELR